MSEERITTTPLNRRVYRFIEYRWYAFGISFLILLAGLGSLLMRDFKWGIEFIGGINTKIEIVPADGVELSEEVLRKHFGDGNMFEEVIIDRDSPIDGSPENAQIYNFRIKQTGIGGDTGTLNQRDFDFLTNIRQSAGDILTNDEQTVIHRLLEGGVGVALQAGDSERLQQTVLKYVVSMVLVENLVNQYAGGKQDAVQILAQEFYSPTMGKDMQETVLIISLVIGLLLLLYITMRFQFKFGLAALLALAHDTILTIGMASVLDREINVPLVIAILTLLGYSINDTIVVFDRIRENSGNIKDRDYMDIINLSITQCLSRTIVTSATVEMVAIPLFVAALFLQVDAFFDLALFLGVGVILGTYSSIFIASPLLYMYENVTRKARLKRKGGHTLKRAPKTADA